jgi:hypothetical protein
MAERHHEAVSTEWVSFPGGELEGKRPKARCSHCRGQLSRKARAVLCFNCYRADFERERAIKAAGKLDTASEARFQSALPFEPVDTSRLHRLKADRAASREAMRSGAGQYVDRRRRAQIEARHTLQAIFEGVRARRLAASARDQQIAAAVHAAELQLPDAWLPFVIAR